MTMILLLIFLLTVLAIL